MNADGTHPWRLTHEPGRDARILFSVDEDGPSRLFVTSADGSNPQVLGTGD